MNIGNFKIGSRVLIIAEIGGNHNGDLDTAIRLIEEAYNAGADAVKFQTYKAETLVHKDEPALKLARSRYKTQFERFKSLEFSQDAYRKLHSLAESRGLLFLSTPFDEKSVDILEHFVSAYKIASGDIDNISLLISVSEKNKPIILSTGMATIEEIEKTLQKLSGHPVMLMHCVSSYPTSDEDANLNSIPFLKNRFPQVPVGFSDHTIGITASIGAVALGAVVIEKHFTLDKAQDIGDHCLSLEPDEFREMVVHIRKMERMLGVRKKEPAKSELAMKERLRRGLAASCDIEKGSIINQSMLMPLRPLKGIPVSQYENILGKRINKDIRKGEFISFCDIEA